MQREIKISSIQLSLLIIALIFSDFPIINHSRFALQDAWIAYLLGMILGLIIITIYILIAKLHTGKNFIEILLTSFGKTIGMVVAVLYIWYFIHVSALVLRSFGEYMSIVNYFETPQFFIIVSLVLAIIYALRKGFEVVARIAELFMPILILSIIILFILLIYKFQFEFLRPVLKDGIVPVLRAGWGMASFPFGELIVLLMIFPYLNEPNKLAKTTYVGVLAGGLLLFLIIVRDLLLLGPSLLNELVFPANVSTAFLPTIGLEPLISMNLLIGGTGFLCVYLYSASLAVSQLAGIEDPKSIVIPIASIVVGLSIWQYDNISQMFHFTNKVYPYYSIFFQVIIPAILLLVSVVKNRGGDKERASHENNNKA